MLLEISNKAPIFIRDHKYILGTVTITAIVLVIFGSCYSSIHSFREILATHKEGSIGIGIALGVILGGGWITAGCLDKRAKKPPQPTIAPLEITPSKPKVDKPPQDSSSVKEESPPLWKMQDYLREMNPLPTTREFRMTLGAWIRASGREAFPPELILGIEDIEFCDQDIWKLKANVAHHALQGVDSKGKRFIGIYSQERGHRLFVERAPGQWIWIHPILSKAEEFDADIESDVELSDTEEKYANYTRPTAETSYGEP
jgi:hypothetical protein